MTSVGVIIQNNSKFLLQLRDNKDWIKNPGKWAFFGGSVDRKEKPLDAIQREIEEELSIKFVKKNFVFLYAFTFNQDKHYLYHLRTEKKVRDFKLREGQDLQYFSLSEILLKPKVMLRVKLLFLLFSIFGNSLNNNIYKLFLSLIFIL